MADIAADRVRDIRLFSPKHNWSFIAADIPLGIYLDKARIIQAVLLAE